MKRILHALAALWRPETEDRRVRPLAERPKREEQKPETEDRRRKSRSIEDRKSETEVPVNIGNRRIHLNFSLLRHAAAVLRMDEIIQGLAAATSNTAKSGAGRKPQINQGEPNNRPQSGSVNGYTDWRIGGFAKTSFFTRSKTPLNRGSSLVVAIIILFMCLTAAQQVSAQAEPADAAIKVDFILPAVTSELITDARQLDRIPQFTPDADLDRFPVKRYRVQPDSNFMGLCIGEDIPDAVWELPLWVVNHPPTGGKDTVTLQDYRDSKLIILDFWARFCTPCMESMDKWEGYMEELGGDVQLIGVQLDFDYKALPTVREKGWQSPTVIGEGAYILNRLFFQRDVISRMVWIRDGKLLAITSGRGYDLDMVAAAAAGQPVEIPIDPNWTYKKGNPITD